MNAVNRGRSVLQTAGMIQSGASDPVKIAEETLAAIEAGNEPGLFTAITADRARAEARQSAERIRAGRPRGLLDGVPIAWKDLFDLAGTVTTVGSKVLASAPPAKQDATVVARLAAAGMVSVGRVGMTEFAFSGLGLNPHYGTPRNPNGKGAARIPGGSSSGSAVAVAKGLVPVAIGTDTGGSVRIPAAFNGIVGYKATRGRYPMDGVFPLATSLDSLGPFCRTVADAVLVDAAMCGRVAPEATRRHAKDLRILVPTNVVFDEVEPAVVKLFEAALARLVSAGVAVERKPIPAFDAVLEINAKRGPLVAAEAYTVHAARLDSPEAAGMDQRVAARMRKGAATSMADYVAIVAARAALIEETRRALGPDTLVAHPTVVHVAPLTQPLETDDALYLKTNALTLRNTMLGNFLDWCGVSLPCGFDEQGMPAGFLLSAVGGCDTALLGAALEIEEIVRA
jgi:aspartyl-tRNA(Asn)/glutamyl-tRNA(Gln) amidotransferase subunit A